MSEEWRCPACDFRSKSFNGVRVHFIKMHMNGKCPACGKKYRSLMRHFERRSDCDLMHAICYGLAAHNQGRGSRRHEAQEWFRECRNLAYEFLKVDNIMLTKYLESVNKTKLTEVLTC